MLAFFWGAPAYDFAMKLQAIEKDEWSSLMYFSGSVTAEAIFRWSKYISMYTPLIWSLVLYPLFFGLSYDVNDE